MLPKVFLIAVITALFSLTVAYGQQKNNSGDLLSPATLNTSKGTWSFRAFPNDIIKVTFLANGSINNEQISDAVIAKPASTMSETVNESGKEIVRLNKKHTITVHKEGLTFAIKNQLLVDLVSSHYSDDARGFTFGLNESEKIFGTGERSVPMDRRGYLLPLNNAPAYGYSLNAESLNFSVPFMISSNGYGIFFDNPSKGTLDIGKTNRNELRYSVTSGELSFYLIPGKSLSEILSNYHTLIGTAPMPPRWAFGNFMSRFGYTSEQHTRGIMSKMLGDSIPFDAVIFDLFWFGDSIKNTLGNLEWVNKTAWPDPAKMINDFKGKGIKTILITEPFVLNTSLNYESSKRLHATDSSGNPYVLRDFYFGRGGIIDIFRKDAADWFYSKYKAQMQNGVAGWWGDLGEPENHPPDVYHNLGDLGFSRKFRAGEVHNIYGHFWSKMLWENLNRDYPGKRLFHLNRSGYAGSPRYGSFPWSGDVSRSWDGLKAQLPLLQGMSISGIPYIHSDAGGYAGGDGDGELYVRWLQFAAFTPIYRPHGTALGSVDPSAKDVPSEAALWPEPTKSLAKEAAKMRYAWLPYNYNLAYLQTKHGKPLMMPMSFLNVKDTNLYKATDQYMWGEQIMVVPVTDKSSTVKRYYVPEGSWTNIHTLQAVKGPKWFSDSNISMSGIPVYAREGSFIPTIGSMIHTGQYMEKLLTVSYFASDEPSSYELYEDDGEDADAISKNRYQLTTFRSKGLGKKLSLTVTATGTYPGMRTVRPITLVINNLEARPVNIKVNGKPVASKWAPEKRQLSILLSFNQKPLEIKFDRN